MTDPNGNVTTQYADYEGRKVQVTDSINGATRTTLMHYDNLGQLDSVSDPEGFKTTYCYDMLGRMIKRIHPDAGETRYTYDNAGNLTKEINPLGQIFYDYTYYRLLKKRYSSMTGNDVTYTYGTSGTETGRPVRIVDGSGMYECRYDALGNVTDETRTIALPNHNEVYRFRTSYQYDSWGRMLSMTYPDGEEVAYTYLWGGDLYSMHGTKGANHRVYVSKILYNTFGQRSQVEYGNQTKAYYTYDALHRLTNLQSRNGSGTLMQDISYTFDSASNVTRIANSAGVVNSLGGGYANAYRYDALHRLVWSSGSGDLGSYSMDMGYTPSGRIGRKNRSAHTETLPESVGAVYGYCDQHQPHAVRRIFDADNGTLHDLRWDGAGNLGQISVANEDALFESGRFLFWTEDSRMHAAVDEKYYSYYTYDHGGERRLKLTGENHLVDVNANYMSTYSALSRPTLYPSAYMVVNSKGYTKHYYAGAERVAARIGGGGLDALISLADGGDSLRTKASHLFTQSIGQVNNRVLENNEPDSITGSVAEQDELNAWIEGIPEQLQASTLIDYVEFTDVIQSLRADHNGGQEREVYFYHSDHLGSASWITDSGGQAIQHLQYLPYGEPYINQRTSGYNERFTFTGKERDEETGYGYFGARYMDHELMTMWLSVDPLADKYPSISPYAYCAWNPMKLVDPDGRDAFDDIGWWKNKKTNKMEWDPEIHDQEELNNKYGNGAGIYKGLTHEENGIYYSLFGTTEKSSSKQGRFTKKMDEVCINHAAWMRSQLKGTDRQETPVDFTGIEKMKDRADKKGIFPTTGENVRDGYSYFCGRANGRMYVTGNMRGTWSSSWSDILRKTNQDVNSNMRTGLYGYHLRVGNVVLIQFKSKADAVAFKDIFYKIFPNVKL